MKSICKSFFQVVEQGRFSFQNQLPGRYSISVGDHANLCWQKPAIAFSIESDSKEDLEFVQTGWVMEVHASHETTLKVKNTEGKVVGRKLGQSLTLFKLQGSIFLLKLDFFPPFPKIF